MNQDEMAQKVREMDAGGASKKADKKTQKQTARAQRAADKAKARAERLANQPPAKIRKARAPMPTWLLAIIVGGAVGGVLYVGIGVLMGEFIIPWLRLGMSAVFAAGGFGATWLFKSS